MSIERIRNEFSTGSLITLTATGIDRYIENEFLSLPEPRNFKDIALLTSRTFLGSINDAVNRATTNHPLDTSDEEVVLRVDDMYDLIAAHFTSMSGNPSNKKVEENIFKAMEKGFELTLARIMPEAEDRSRLLKDYNFASRIYDGGKYQTDLIVSERIGTKFPGVQLAKYKDPDATSFAGGIGLAVIVQREKPKHMLPRYRGRE